MRQSARDRRDALIAHDQGLWSAGNLFAGIDEVGRGPLAGPVAAACVVMPEEPLLTGIDDSKRVPEPRREALYEQILAVALFAGVGYASVQEIDALNIRQATKLAMSRAATGAPCALFLIDGNDPCALPGEVRMLVGGDRTSYAIAAASIVAKVARDRLMRALDGEYPGYGFAQHKGYGTPAHLEALRAQGPCPAHRALFIRGYV